MKMQIAARFGEVEAALAGVHAIASDKRTAFQARLKNFLRLGLLDDVKSGRGRAASFDADHILLLAVALELTQLGAGPELAIGMVRGSIGRIAQGVMDTLCPAGAPDHAIFCRATVSSLEDLSNWKDSMLGIQCGKASYAIDMLKLVSEHPDGLFRIAIFSLSALILQLPGILKPNDDDYREHFRARLQAWAEPIAENHMIDWAKEMAREDAKNG
jgi:hypothetical protein